ncbi:MAG TPA: dTDP-4-dehydrorhamnose 3,5-epimerase family protein [Candidatus Levybacteria bacterium]|nr:dTDP-4-dehydrorhamnose 3,5-epimerase family protein [Candidatus Levybacteria bacterium]
MDTNYTLALEPSNPEWPNMIQTTEIPQLLLYERQTFPDNRGYFKEIIELRDLETVLGKQIHIAQANHSKSIPKVIRGIHSEPWEKVIYVPKGTVKAVFVDLRTDSHTFGKAISITFSDSNRKAVYLPKGIGNSYANIGEEDAEYIYMVTDYYKGEETPAVNLNDPQLTKQFGGWEIENPIISDTDKKHPTLKEKFGHEIDFNTFEWLK